MSGVASEERLVSQVEATPDKNAEKPVLHSDSAKQNTPSHQMPHLVVVTEDAQNAQRMGPRLKAAREAMGKTIEEAAKSTRIQKDYLIALEDMRPNLIPGMPKTMSYLRGYLVSYVKWVGLPDVDDVVNRFLLECGLLGEKQEEHQQEQVETERSGSGWMKPLAAAAAFGLIALGAGGAWVFMNATQLDEPSGVVIAAVETAPTDVASVASTTLGAIATSPNLTIQALERSWIEVRGADGTVYLSKQLNAGEVYIPRVGAGWTVTARDGGAFEWRLDGETLGLLSETGQPVYAASVDLALERLASEPAAE